MKMIDSTSSIGGSTRPSYSRPLNPDNVDNSVLIQGLNTPGTIIYLTYTSIRNREVFEFRVVRGPNNSSRSYILENTKVSREFWYLGKDGINPAGLLTMQPLQTGNTLGVPKIFMYVGTTDNLQRGVRESVTGLTLPGTLSITSVIDEAPEVILTKDEYFGLFPRLSVGNHIDLKLKGELTYTFHVSQASSSAHPNIEMIGPEGKFYKLTRRSFQENDGSVQLVAIDGTTIIARFADVKKIRSMMPSVIE